MNNKHLKLVEKTFSADVEVDWTQPAIGANPFMMAMTWQIAAAKTLVEGQQKKMIKFLTTGVWPV